MKQQQYTPTGSPSQAFGVAIDGDDNVIIAGYTQQDGDWALFRRQTGRVLMLKLSQMFADGFE